MNGRWHLHESRLGLNMPFTLTEQDGLLIVTATGQVSAAELLHLHSDLAGETSRHEGCLIDFKGADVSKLTGPIVNDLADLPPKFKRLAIIANPGPAHGLARMYQASAGYGRAIGAFTTVDTARTWLLKKSPAA
jgi:hypothetical protein